MPPASVSIAAIGITPAGLILNGRRQTRREFEQLRAEMIARTDQLKAEMIARMDKLTADVAGLRREVSGLDSRLSRLEGAGSATFFSRPPLVETAEHGD